LRNNFFKTIGFNDTHSNSPRTHPESTTECQKFRVNLRSFINLEETKWTSLDGEYELSEQLKNFSKIAKKARQEYIMEVFYKNNPAPLFRPIPITNQESIAQENETQMTKAQILLKIESLLEEMNESIQKKYRGLKSRSRSELLTILQEVRYLFNNEIDDNDLSESSNTNTTGIN
jgi:hypothetical protein